VNIVHAILFAILAVAPCSCTTIVVLWTPTSTLLGADAKVRFGDGKPGGTACKIGVSKNILWAQSGWLGVRDSPTAVSDILAEELNSSDAIDYRISRAESRISAAMTSQFNLPLIKPAVLANPDKHQVQFVAISLENGTTRMVMRSFTPRKGASRNVEIDIARDACPDAPNCGRTEYLGLGLHDEADRILKNDPAVWNKNPKDIIEYLIGTEIKALPDDVGQPITIIGIDAGGIHWLSKGACADK
jgi:hypothetical protein